MSEMKKVALLVGAGDAIGAAVAKRFAQGGFSFIDFVCVTPVFIGAESDEWMVGVTCNNCATRP